MIGTLQKMRTEHQADSSVQYYLRVGQNEINMNQFIGKKIKFQFTGNIFCSSCNKKTPKSYSQGYCYNCMIKLPQCDSCQMRPETCSYFAGKCRDEKWGEENCMIDHTVYLANSSGLKVGITRKYQQIHRWMDQGAVSAIPLFTVKKRLDAGLLEVELKEKFADKTNWRKMLKGETENIDLRAQKEELVKTFKSKVDFEISNDDSYNFDFPVDEYPTKISSLSFDKDKIVEGVLKGIKGQYLIFEHGVINIRKFSSYQIKFTYP